MSKLVVLLLTLSILLLSSLAFESDELLVDDEEFGLEGGESRSSPPVYTRPTTTTTRKRYSDPDSDSKIQFSLDHAFGDSDFSPAGTFSARLKTSSHGSQTLTKLRFSRDDFTDVEKKQFEKLLQDDEFYRIRLPSNVLRANGEKFSVSSVKARCLPREGLDEHFTIHMEGANILAVNYGSPGACPHPRPLKHPAKWSFSSYTIMKNTELAPRTPIFTEDILGGESVEGEIIAPPERTFWAKYWMYMIPLGLVVMNVLTQAMGIAEEQAGGQPGSQGQQPAAAIQRGPVSGSGSAVRRR